eukprot:1147772-Pelagomonas_calceolata.AAC.1
MLETCNTHQHTPISDPSAKTFTHLVQSRPRLLRGLWFGPHGFCVLASQVVVGNSCSTEDGYHRAVRTSETQVLHTRGEKKQVCTSQQAACNQGSFPYYCVIGPEVCGVHDSVCRAGLIAQNGLSQHAHRLARDIRMSSTEGRESKAQRGDYAQDSKHRRGDHSMCVGFAGTPGCQMEKDSKARNKAIDCRKASTEGGHQDVKHRRSGRHKAETTCRTASTEGVITACVWALQGHQDVKRRRTAKQVMKQLLAGQQAQKG